MIAVAVRHLHIHSGPDAGRKIHAGSPVTHDKPFIAPSVPQNTGQQFPVFTGRYAIQIIVADHNRSRSCSLHRLFKSCQINLVHSPLIDHGIRSHAVSFLIISCKVLQRSSDTTLLHGTDISHCQFSRKERIFRIILEIPSAKRGTFDVDSGTEHNRNTQFLCLLRNPFCHLSDEDRIPGARHAACRWKTRCLIAVIVLGSILLRPDTMRSIRHLKFPDMPGSFSRHKPAHFF